MEVKYLAAPMHPITVLIIGAGGTGSQMLQQLGRMDYALRKLNKTGFAVAMIDDDKVSESNCGRQLFNESEVGEYKASVLISRINRFYGIGWLSYCSRFDEAITNSFNVIITCTDNADSRLMVQRYVKKQSKQKAAHRHENDFHYWIDMGNTKTTGQVICGSPKYKIPTVIDMYPNIKKLEKGDDTPSCSLAEALEKQDLFINTFVSNVAAKLLWEMCTKPVVDWRGAYINLDTLNTKKIPA